MYWFTRAWDRASEAVDGLKALGSAAVLFLLGIADYIDVVPIRPLLEKYLGVEATSTVFIYMAIFFSTLRFVSTRNPFRGGFRRHRNLQECDHNDGEPF